LGIRHSGRSRNGREGPAALRTGHDRGGPREESGDGVAGRSTAPDGLRRSSCRTEPMNYQLQVNGKGVRESSTERAELGTERTTAKAADPGHVAPSWRRP